MSVSTVPDIVASTSAVDYSIGTSPYFYYLRNKTYAKKIAIFFAIIAAAAVAVIGTIALSVLIPGLPIPLLFFLGFTGFVVEVIVYKKDLRKVFGMLFGEGITNIFSSIKHNLETKIVLREYKNYKKYIASLDNENKTAAQLNKKLTNVDLKLIEKLNRRFKNHFEPNPLDEKKFKKAFLAWRITHPNRTFFSKNSNLATEFRFKRILLIGALGLAGVNGICFGLITYAGIIAALAIFTFSNPIAPIVIAAIFAVFATVAFTAVMYRMLAESITDNVFKRIWKRVKKLIMPEKAWREMSHVQQIKHVALVSLKLGIIITVLGLSIYATIATAGTYIQSATSALQQLMTVSHIFQYISSTFQSYLSVNAIVTGINVLGTMLVAALIPNEIAFSCERSVEAAGKIFKIGKLAALSIKTSFEEFKTQPVNYTRTKATAFAKFITNPLKVIAASVALIMFTATILHFVVEGALSAVGFKNPTDIVSQKLFQAADFLLGWTKIDIGIFLSITAFITSFGQETLVDADYLIPKQSKQISSSDDHGASYTSVLNLLRKIPGTAKLEKHFFPEPTKSIAITNIEPEKKFAYSIFNKLPTDITQKYLPSGTTLTVRKIKL